MDPEPEDLVEDFLEWLRTWAEAYPEDQFPPLDMRTVEPRDYSRDEVMGLAVRNAAEMARHCLRRVLARAEDLR